MRITPIKTHKITAKDKDLFKILDKYLPSIREKTILAVTSKIVAICQGQMVKMDEVDKDYLIEQEAQYFLPRLENKYGVSLAIKNNILAAAAGIDESNGEGYYILWPKNPQESANKIREYLVKRFNLKRIGVILTDSKTTPLRWGVTGIALAHSGFQALNNYIGKSDLFGRRFHFTKVNVMDGLAAAAVLAMGEGREQTPLCLVEEPTNVIFQLHNPTKEELNALQITIEEDLYGDFLKKVKWRKGKG